jgi:hypothetical protein
MRPRRRPTVHGVGPALLLGAVVLPMVLYWGDLPNPMAVHWGISGSPDGSLPPFVLLLVLGGGYVAVWWSVLQMILRAPGETASFTARLYGIGGLLAGVQWLAVIANRGASGWGDADPIGWTGLVAVPACAALLAGVGWLLAGGRAARPPRSEVEVPTLAVEHPEHMVWSGRARSPIVILIGLALIVGGLAVWGWSTLGLAIIGLLVLTFSEVRVTIGSGGAVIGLGWLGFPSWTVPMAEISGASVERLLPLAYGGWGYRIRPGSRAVVVRGGDALRLRREAKADLVVTVDDAGTGAGLVNSILGSRQ